MAGRAWLLRASAGGRRLLLETLLAREPGETRALDDVFGAVRYVFGSGTTIAAGDLLPALGSGLLLGPRRLRTPGPGPPVGAGSGALRLLPLPNGSPALAAAAWRGLWVERPVRGVRLGALVARTGREARRSGQSLLPVAGRRHRTPAEEARRGALDERFAALAFAAGHEDAAVGAWGALALARTGWRRAPPPAAGNAAEAAAPVVRGGPAGTLGLALGGRSFRRRGARGRREAAEAPPRLEAEWAWDAHGRARTRIALACGAGRTGAGLLFEGQAAGYTPPRALPETVPRSHLVARVEGRVGSVGLRLEGHVVDRGALLPRRFWLATALRPTPGLLVETRRDADPRRTLVAFRAAGRASPQTLGHVALEVRLEGGRVARETWAAGGTWQGPAGLEATLATSLSSGRASWTVFDGDVPGGGFLRRSGASARTRLEVRRAGVVRPALGFTRTEGEFGRVSLGWFALAWGAARD